MSTRPSLIQIDDVLAGVGVAVLRHDLRRNAVAREDLRSALRREQREPELVQAVRRQQHVALVAVGDRDEHGARVRHAAVGGDLALGERDGERLVDAHHLAGGAHLGSEHRIDDLPCRGPEALERQHRFLHRHRCARRHHRAVGYRQQPLFAQRVDLLARHDPARRLSERDAERLRHERHCAAGARVRLDHVENARR